jgi:hypothetical protein
MEDEDKPGLWTCLGDLVSFSSLNCAFGIPALVRLTANVFTSRLVSQYSLTANVFTSRLVSQYSNAFV